jgi:putative membrane protein
MAAALFACAAVMSAQQSDPPATASRAAPAVSADESFVKEAAAGGMAEVELGRLATEKAASARVKSFGQKMVADHGTANDSLKSLAASKQIAMNTSVDAAHRARYDRLKSLSGSNFDRAYVTSLLTDHEKDVAAFRREATSGRDPDVKAWAAKTLPTLEEHLNMVQDLRKEVVATGN